MAVSSRYKLTFILYLSVMFIRHSDAVCYQCATDSIVENWTRYGLPLLRGSSMEGDSNCKEEKNTTQTIACEGLCVTMNVTREYKGQVHVLGVLRDCQRYWKEPQELESARQCNVSTRVLNRKTTIDIEYCFCKGDYCNGLPAALQTKKGSMFARRTLHRRRSGVGGVFVGFMVFAIVALVTSVF